MTSSLVVDTQSVIWTLTDPSQLSNPAKTALQTAEATPGATLFMSVITIIEIVYLIEKWKFPPSLLSIVLSVLDDATTCWQVLPVDERIARGIDGIPRAIVPDMPDRIIAATALVHHLPLISSDAQIQQAPITVIW